MKTLPPSEAFVDQIMRAIVNQFFENPPIVVLDGSGYVQPRTTPSQVVAARLLSDKQGELLDKIMERIDLDVLAEQVAQKVVETLTKPDTRYGYSDPDQSRRAEIKKKVEARLVELMAADLFAKMQPADCSCGAIEYGEMSQHLVPCPLASEAGADE